MMKAQDLNTKIITKKPKSARNCESRVNHVEDALKRANKAILDDAEHTAEQSWTVYLDLEDSGSYVLQDGELFREEPGGTYTPVGRVRKRDSPDLTLHAWLPD